jgi:hypothetical protein
VRAVPSTPRVSTIVTPVDVVGGIAAKVNVSAAGTSVTYVVSAQAGAPPLNTTVQPMCSEVKPAVTEVMLRLAALVATLLRLIASVTSASVTSAYAKWAPTRPSMSSIGSARSPPRPCL